MGNITAYHGCTPLKHWIYLQTGALPTFNQEGILYVARNKGTCREYTDDPFGWDTICLNISRNESIQSNPLLYPGITEIPESPLKLQLLFTILEL